MVSFCEWADVEKTMEIMATNNKYLIGLIISFYCSVLIINEGDSRIGPVEKLLLLFCVSILLTYRAGEIAETGTLPEDAPQLPLKTPEVSPEASILENMASGVPTNCTPLTNSSSLPST